LAAKSLEGLTCAGLTGIGGVRNFCYPGTWVANAEGASVAGPGPSTRSVFGVIEEPTLWKSPGKATRARIDREPSLNDEGAALRILSVNKGKPRLERAAIADLQLKQFLLLRLRRTGQEAQARYDHSHARCYTSHAVATV
jgi:hypothetical protein